MVRNQAPENLTIAGLARAGSVGIETVRYYQRRGLLETPLRGQGSGSIRRYGPDAVRRLNFIRAAQTAGFTLEEIIELLRLDSTADRPRARQLAQARIMALDQKIKELQAARRALSRLARDCASGDKGPCPIIEAFTD